MDNITIVDTSAWIFALSKKYHPKIKDRVDELLKENSIAIVPIIKLELLAGTKTEKEYKRLKMRLDALTHIEIDREKWEEAYKLAFQLRRKGIIIPFVDIIIIACAKKESAGILHADKHFDNVGKFVKVKMESFVSEVN